MLVQVLAIPISNQLLASVPGKAADERLRTGAPATHVGYQDGVLGFWLA